MTALTYNQVLDRYFYLTGVVLLIYDHLLTLESEVRYIWTTDHTRSLAWYLLVRYFRPLHQRDHLCFGFCGFLCEATLILRVLAMFSFDKRVVASLASAAIIVICLFIRTAVGSEPPHVYRTNLSGCYSVSSNARCSLGIAGAWEGV
ncbi:hypothetical protein B0H14DRAFT_2638228 [Mycena olivaceomarginata]|nr:hypothetical protein B0H14DRAFT_2638228 [Mycena olivaceomarginata]